MEGLRQRRDKASPPLLESGRSQPSATKSAHPQGRDQHFASFSAHDSALPPGRAVWPRQSQRKTPNLARGPRRNRDLSQKLRWFCRGRTSDCAVFIAAIGGTALILSRDLRRSRWSGRATWLIRLAGLARDCTMLSSTSRRMGRA